MEDTLPKMSKDEKRKQAKLSKHSKPGMIVMPETVFCPICGASSYPSKPAEWSGPPEKIPLFCGACGRNMEPAVRAMKQYMKDYVNFVRDEPVEKIDDSEV